MRVPMFGDWSLAKGLTCSLLALPLVWVARTTIYESIGGD